MSRSRFGISSLIVAAACAGGSPAYADEPLESVSPISAPEDGKDLSIEEIMAQIECRQTTTLNGADSLTDNQLLEILKCNDITRVDLIVNDNSIGLQVALSSGEELEHELLISFGQDLQKYLLKKGINVATVQKGFFGRYGSLIISLLLGLTFAAFLSRSRIDGFIRGDKYKPLSERPDVTFDDIGGLKNIKKDLISLVEDIKDREEILAKGGKVPRGGAYRIGKNTHGSSYCSGGGYTIYFSRWT